MNSNDLAVFVDAITIFCTERVVVFVLHWKLDVTIILTNNIFSLVCQISIIGVVLNQTLFRDFTVMNRSLDFWSNDRHSCYNSLNRDILVDKVCFETTGRDMILSEIAFEIDVVLLDFCWERFVSLESGFLIVTLLVAGVVLDDTIKL